MPGPVARLPKIVSRVLRGLPREGRALVRNAYYFADKKFAGKFRLDGRPSIDHLTDAALIMREEMQLRDPPSLAAELLHDVLEDTETKIDEVAAQFGDEVAGLVQGETKLGREDQRVDRELVNDRNWHIALSDDARIGLMKAADRRSNMRDQSVFSEAKRQEHARETRDIYAVVMDRFGVWEMKTRLEDQAYRYLMPDFTETHALYELTLAKTKEAVDKRAQTVASEIRKYGIRATVAHKYRTISEVYDRMKKENRSLADILAENPFFLDYLSIILEENNVPMCAAALEVARQVLGPYDRAITSYHGLRREDTGYEAEHARVLVPKGWLLVGATHKAQDLRNRLGIISDGLAVDFKPGWHKSHPGWLERWRTYLLQARILTEEQLREDFAKVTSRISVLTPSGLRTEVSVGSTVLDYAFQHGTECGLHAQYGMINGRKVGLGRVLEPNDVVDISGVEKIKIDPSWLTQCRSLEAATGIRTYLSAMSHKQQKRLALASLRRGLAPHRLSWGNLSEVDWLGDFLWELGEKYDLQINNFRELIMAIGSGSIGPHDVIQEFLAFHEEMVRTRKVLANEGKFQVINFPIEIMVADEVGRLNRITQKLKELGLNIFELHSSPPDQTGQSKTNIVVQTYTTVQIAQIRRIMNEEKVRSVELEQMRLSFSSPPDDQRRNP